MNQREPRPYPAPVDVTRLEHETFHWVRGDGGADDVRRIAEQKMPDLNAEDIDAAAKIIAGTARSMGVEVGA